jgi:hypothetical protein
MNKELNEDARTKQDLLYECSSLESKLSNEIIKNEHLEQQCKKQKEVIDKLNDLLSDEFLEVIDRDTLLDILKEVSK